VRIFPNATPTSALTQFPFPCSLADAQFLSRVRGIMAAYRCFLALWTLIRRVRICVPLFVVALFSVACVSEPMPVHSASDCDEWESEASVPGYPWRLPHSHRFPSDDHRHLPSSNDVPWFVDSDKATSIRLQKYLMAQPAPPQERSPFYGGAVPRCPQRPELAIALELEREANEAGEKAGQQYGEVMGRIEAGIDFLANGWAHDGVLLKRILADPGEREALLQSIATELDGLPELPTYWNDTLARAALAGFQKGYKEGIDAAHWRAVLINASVDLCFMAIGNIAGALESAAARLLDKAIMRLRGMPIFVPGTVGGAGFFMRTIPRVVNGSSRKLLQALLKAGKEPLKGEVPHHVVSHTDVRAEEARKILAKFDVGIDSADNGVFLPGTTKAPNPKGKAVHSTVHTDRYYKAVEAAIKDAVSKEDLIDKLQKLSVKLENGGL